MSDDNELLDGVFFHNYRKRIADAVDSKNGQTFLSHYTDARNLFQILEDKSVVLRNARTLGDYSEIDHGFRLIEKGIDGAAGKRLSGVIASVWPNLSLPGIWGLFAKNHMPVIRDETYIFSMCEHPVSERVRDFGRLSMWRYYGGAASPVALVINSFKTAFVPSDAAGMYTFPVEYVIPEEDGLCGLANWILLEFDAIAQALADNRSRLLGVPENVAMGYMMRVFHLMGLRTKHVAFEEEREWRVICTPYFSGPLPPTTPEVTSYFGSPQKIVRLRLGKYSQDGGTPLDLSLGNILHRVLIGPVQDADLIRHSIIVKLEQAGVPNPASIVEMTNIPVRASKGRP
jgi:hypothetical protein